MPARLNKTHQPFVASEAEAVLARKAADRLKAIADARETVSITLDGKTDRTITVPLPPRAVALIHQMLEAMATQTPMSLIPHETELTTQQAADYLNVSRPHLIRQIDEGRLPCRKVGTHRRIRFADLIAYETAMRDEQRQALEELDAEAIRLGLE